MISNDISAGISFLWILSSILPFYDNKGRHKSKQGGGGFSSEIQAKVVLDCSKSCSSLPKAREVSKGRKESFGSSM